MLMEVANLNPAKDERERLIRHICENVRAQAPRAPLDQYFRFKQRLQKTPIDVLRQILEEDVVNVTAAQFVRERVQA